MVKITEETIIDAPARSVFGFLTHVDLLYKTWHRKDHVFYKALVGTLDKKRCIIHFYEFINKFPIYLIVRVTELKNNELIEYRPIFPFSWLKVGMGYFKIEAIAENKSKLIAHVEFGDKFKIIDKIVQTFIKESNIRKHIREEGEYLKKYLEYQNLK